jgi:hypothetical protein
MIEVGHIVKKAFSQQINNAKLQLGIWPKRTCKELATKLKFGTLSLQEKKEAKNTLWTINAIYHEGAKELLSKKHAECSSILTDGKTLGSASTPLGSSKSTRMKKLRLTRAERKGFRRIQSRSKHKTETMSKFLEDIRDIDTLQAHYRAMEITAQRANNIANATIKRKHRLISSQDDVGIKQYGRRRTKRKKEHKRNIYKTARNTKRSKVYKEVHNKTSNTYVQGTVTDGIQEYLTRLSTYID